jgi:hypothetical protein
VLTSTLFDVFEMQTRAPHRRDRLAVFVSLFLEKSRMRSLFILAVAGVAVALSATAAQAATLNFTGDTGASTELPFLANGTFSLSATYIEAANATSTTLSGPTTFSIQADGGGTLEYSLFSGGTLGFGTNNGNNTMTVSGVFATQGLGSIGNLNLTFTRAPGSLLSSFVTSANVATMLSNPTTYEGTFTLATINAEEAVLSGTIPVPEPGSISLLAGLGLVCGRRVWRRRQQKQAAAV